MANKLLNSAKTAKKDEFYTQLSDVENELRHYRPHFKGKTVADNCQMLCVEHYRRKSNKYFPRRQVLANTKDNFATHKLIIDMPQLINTGDELLRINTVRNTIEISRNGGRSWVTHCANSTSYGTFRDLFQYGGEILACTSRGLYVSTNGGRGFAPRCQNTSTYGEFQTLSTDPSGNLLANTSKGLYISRNGGRGWVRR